LSWAQRAARLADTPERVALAEQALGLARLALGDVSTQPDPSEQISRPLALPDLGAAERARTQLHLAFVALTRGDLQRAEGHALTSCCSPSTTSPNTGATAARRRAAWGASRSARGALAARAGPR
jgi:hypothetical protein